MPFKVVNSLHEPSGVIKLQQQPYSIYKVKHSPHTRIIILETDNMTTKPFDEQYADMESGHSQFFTVVKL